jgi:hypothetical protein
LNVDINHIGVREMTQYRNLLAVTLSALAFVTLWLPTLSVPAAAQVPATAVSLVELA